MKKSILLCFTFVACIQLSEAHTNVCKERLADLAYEQFLPATAKVARENARNFKETTKAGIVLGKVTRLNALHIVDPQNRFPESAQLHAVIFDRFGFNQNDFLSAQNKIKTLSTNDASPEKIAMGAEAFSPNTHLSNIEAAAQWMKAALLEVQGQKPDARPTVVYARGALCEVAVYLAQKEPQLFSALVLENPISASDHTQLPQWNSNSFAVPTYITTGTHDKGYLHGLKQKLYNLSRDTESPDGQRRVHYMDMPFAESDVFGVNVKDNAKELAHLEIYRFLNTHVLGKKYPSEDNTPPERFVQIAQSKGIGLRRWFGHRPRPTPQNEINAIRAGVLMWEMPVKAVSSVEEAKAHIEKLRAVKEKPENDIINRPVFFISNHPKLKHLSESKDLADALSQLNGDPVNLIREAAQSGNKFFEIDESGNILDYDPNLILEAPLEAVYLGDNKNGFVFNASGWTLPVIRGVIDLEEAKKSHAYKTGRILYIGAMDRKGKVTKPGIAAEGFYFKKNRNLAGVLEKLRNMQRKGQSENATRFLDPFNIILMQRLYEAGLLETYELYNPKGELVAGGINVKIDNVLSPETLFYPNKTEGEIPADAPLSQTLEGVEYAKMVITYMIDDAAKDGHKKMDSQIVSSFTILFNPRYVRTDNEFLPFIKETNEGWETYQKHLAAERQKEHAHHSTLLEGQRATLQALEEQLSEAEAAYVVAREKAEELKIDRDITETERQDPSIMATIQASRDAKKEARRIETEIVQIKAKLDAILAEFIPNSSVLSTKEIRMLISFSREKAERAKTSLEEANASIAKLAEAYNKAVGDQKDDLVPNLKSQLDKANVRAAGFRVQLDEAQGRIVLLQQILSSREE